MAKETKTSAAEAVETAAATESVYEAAEFAANAPNLFGFSADMATAAFAYNHVERCTLDEARKIIKAFAERKVN